MLTLCVTPQPRSMMSLMAWTLSVCGSSLANVTIQGWGMPSSGQIIPQSNRWGKHAPIDNFIASIDVLQIVDKKNPNDMPQSPKIN